MYSLTAKELAFLTDPEELKVMDENIQALQTGDVVTFDPKAARERLERRRSTKS